MTEPRHPPARRRPGAALAPLLTLLALTLLPTSTAARTPEAGPPAVDPAPLVDDLVALIGADYVFPEKAPALVAMLRRNLEAGAYDGRGDGDLAQRLTADLREASTDLHFNVLPERLAPPPPERTPEARRRRLDHQRRSGYGFRRVEILDGNVGYVEIGAFVPPEVAAGAADAVMALVAGTDALIFDLRTSGGGDAGMVGRLIAHLVGGEPFVFNRFYWRPTDSTADVWTPRLPGPAYTGRVYLLTSGSTPSAAEGFTYHLKHLGRATVVGSRTAGAAHPVVTRRVGGGAFVAYVPAGRAISPVTGTNWEGTGVIPHVEVPPEEARTVAHRAALEALAGEHAGSDPAWASRLREMAAELAP